MRADVIAPLAVALLLAPCGVAGVAMLNPYGSLALLAVSIASVGIAWRRRSRIPSLARVPNRVFAASMAGCVLLLAGAYALVFAFLWAISPPSTASEVMDATRLPANGHQLTRRDTGSSSASSSVVTIATPEPMSVGSVQFPRGFNVTLEPLGASAECDWATPKPCSASWVERSTVETRTSPTGAASRG